MSPNSGPPPVQPSRAVAVAEQPRGQQVIQANYTEVVNTLKENNGAEAKAIRAMLGGDKALMDRFLATAFSLLAKQNDLLFRATPISIVQSIWKSTADSATTFTPIRRAASYIRCRADRVNWT